LRYERGLLRTTNKLYHIFLKYQLKTAYLVLFLVQINNIKFLIKMQKIS